MILIDAITSGDTTYPERALTPTERATVIGMWFFNDTYRYFQVGDEAELAARQEAQRLIDLDIASDSQQTVALIVTLMTQDPENYMENYIESEHPGEEIFPPAE